LARPPMIEDLRKAGEKEVRFDISMTLAFISIRISKVNTHLIIKSIPFIIFTNRETFKITSPIKIRFITGFISMTS